MSDTLMTWLRGQLDDDQAHAEKDIWAADRSTPGNWTTRYGVNLPSSWVETESTPVARLDGPRHDADGLLIARFKPDNVRRRAARVLAEVDAKRRILDAHPFESGTVGGVCGTCHGAGWIEEYWDGEEETVEHVDTEMPWPCPTVRLLALPYADRPGYREEWRP